MSRNDDVVLVINDDDEIIYSFVTYYAYDKEETPDAPVYDTDTDFDAPALVRNTITIAYTGEEPGRAAIEDQVIAAVKAEYTDATEVAVSNLDVDAGTVTVSITRANNTVSSNTYDLAFYNKTIDAVATAAQAIPGYTFTADSVTVVGNTVTMEDTDMVAGTAVRDVYMNDVARFLGALYRTANKTEIKFEGTTYKWAGETLDGSNWTVNGEPVVSSPAANRNTLVYAIFGSTETTAKNPSTITLTVDGVEMIINLVK